MESISQTLNITLDELAMNAARSFQKSVPEYREKALRVYLSGKNCDGFEYGVCFDSLEPNDLFKDFSDIQLICDKDSYQFLDGSHITFVDSESGKGFVVENPSHKKFRGKFFKRKQWVEKLS